MDSELDRNVYAERAFWVAAGLAVLGGAGPFLAAAGHTNRIGGVFVPFLAAALAMVAVSLTYRRGRAVAALIYFVGGLAVAYGLLLVLAVPLRLAVVGTCPPAPQLCNNGAEMQLTTQEGTGLTVAVAFGVMSLGAGFVGLAMLYRQLAPKPAAPVWPAKPPPPFAPAATPGSKEPEGTENTTGSPVPEAAAEAVPEAAAEAPPEAPAEAPPEATADLEPEEDPPPA